MASQDGAISLTSHQTALAIVPSASVAEKIDRLRAPHDKSYGKWPAHINIIYPFVKPELLPEAEQRIKTLLAITGPIDARQAIQLQLSEASHFAHRHSSTVFMSPNDVDGAQELKRLRDGLLQAFRTKGESFRPHLTIGQTSANDSISRDHLEGKARLLLPLDWRVEELVILVRETIDPRTSDANQMRVWGTIPICQTEPDPTQETLISGRWPQAQAEMNETTKTDVSACQPRETYRFSSTERLWIKSKVALIEPQRGRSKSLKVASYNVLVESFEKRTERHPLLSRIIASESSAADVLVLQEASDEFLSFLLGQDDVRARYPFSTHGPPNQAGLEPLASLRNVVILSRWRFTWELLPFKERHKGAVIVKLDHVGLHKNGSFRNLVVAGVHLIHGLTDSLTRAKQAQIQSILHEASKAYADHPFMIVGDFNITTSSHTIDLALQNGTISDSGASDLASLDGTLADAQMLDTWSLVGASERGPGPTSRSDDDWYEGEGGATFDPLENPLAAISVGQSLNFRPQRYDRILFRAGSSLQPLSFNFFGRPEQHGAVDTARRDGNDNPEVRFASDHWGIRASFDLGDHLQSEQSAIPRAPKATSRMLVKALELLGDDDTLTEFLRQRQVIPTQAQSKHRQGILNRLQTILQVTSPGRTQAEVKRQQHQSVVVAPVGSYGLGVWRSSSDLDVSCIGSLSTKDFFTFAVARLEQDPSIGVKSIRKVEAASGTMLRIEIEGIEVDLQYCSAANIARMWPEILRLPPTDPAFDMPVLSLSKMKPLRDQDFLLQTIPRLDSYRLAHRLVVHWATERGIYSSKFGYLGGFHIAMMLSRVCKLISREASNVTTADIICSFFAYYSEFDWMSEIVCDPEFHHPSPRYHRTVREPMVILGPHVPNINVARTASLPTLATIREELQRADAVLKDKQASWPDLAGDRRTANGSAALTEFLNSYPSYVRIDLQHWDLSPTKADTLVGWLESRCIFLLVDISRKLPALQARIWPSIFRCKTPSRSQDSEYHGCYLVGLRRNAGQGAESMSEGDRKVAQGKLQMAISTFVDQIRADEKYFDASSSWIEATQVGKSKVQDLQLKSNAHDTVMAAAGENEPLDFSDLETDPGAKDLLRASSDVTPGKSFGTRSSSSSGKRLRPAGDVLHRLRWDPNMHADDYIVGYDDRFLGAREIPLSKWKTEQTDDEFIPQHRILYFRRRPDGVKIWDRESRKDDVFGSGSG